MIGNPTRHSKDILRKAKGNDLDQVHSDQMVLKRSGGGGWSLLSKAKSLKINSKKTLRLESALIRWFS